MDFDDAETVIEIPAYVGTILLLAEESRRHDAGGLADVKSCALGLYYA